MHFYCAFRLAKEVGLDASALKGVLELIEELSQLLQGLSLIKEVNNRLHFNTRQIPFWAQQSAIINSTD
jgi:hypothetical protein